PEMYAEPGRSGGFLLPALVAAGAMAALVAAAGRSLVSLRAALVAAAGAGSLVAWAGTLVPAAARALVALRATLVARVLVARAVARAVVACARRVRPPGSTGGVFRTGASGRLRMFGSGTRRLRAGGGRSPVPE